MAIAVTHPDYAQHLWLGVARPGKGRPPCSLRTTQAITGEGDASNIVCASARRWQIAMAWRFSKSELACESPRLGKGDIRLKLLLLVSLV